MGQQERKPLVSGDDHDGLGPRLRDRRFPTVLMEPGSVLEGQRQAVGVRRCRRRYCRVGCAQALAAGPAKAPARSDRGTALRAAGFQAGTALFAELVLGWVVTLAASAAHDASLLRPHC